MHSSRITLNIALLHFGSPFQLVGLPWNFSFAYIILLIPDICAACAIRVSGKILFAYLLCFSVCRVDSKSIGNALAVWLRVLYLSPDLQIGEFHLHHCHVRTKQASILLPWKPLLWPMNLSMSITNQGELFSPVHKLNLTVISLSLRRNYKPF